MAAQASNKYKINQTYITSDYKTISFNYSYYVRTTNVYIWHYVLYQESQVTSSRLQHHNCDYVTFSIGNNWLATHQKVNQIRSSDTITKNFRLPRIWNHLPVINLNLQSRCTYIPLESFLDLRHQMQLLLCVSCSKHPKASNFDFLWHTKWISD